MTDFKKQLEAIRHNSSLFSTDLELNADHVAEILSVWTGIPVTKLIDGDETIYEAAKREMFEETGLALTPQNTPHSDRPYFSSPGMTDETCSIVFGTCSGEPTNLNQEASEDIQVILVDRDECIRILAEEKLDMRTALMLRMVI